MVTMQETVGHIRLISKPRRSHYAMRQVRKRGMSRPNERLKRARIEAGYTTAVEAARAFGWNENTYIANENGYAPFSKGASVRYARAFRVELDWLVTGSGAMRKTSRGVPVVGYVGAGAQVFPIDDGGLDPVVPPFPVPDGAHAMIVRGDSMLPAYRDGTYLILQRLDDPKDAVNRRAVVTLADTSRWIKEVAPGLSPGRFSLLSYNATPILDVVITEASRVLGTVEP